MIVSLRHRFIFLAVPRTASHAIRVALLPFLAPGDWEQEGLLRRVRSPLPAIARMSHGHVTLRQVRRHLPAAVWRSSFTFAVVRNPYDRYVSACTMLNRHDPEYAGNETAAMKRMLAALHGGVDTSVFRRLTLLRPQTDLLMDEAGRIGVDFVGRYEDLPGAFAEICRRIGIPEARLPRVNATAHRPADTYYDDELRRLVTRFYRRDFALLDYPPRDEDGA